MWIKTYSKKVTGVNINKIWSVWTDVNNWHTWQDDIDYAKIEGVFEVGNTFLLKPKGGPKVKIEIIRVEETVNFTDLTKFPLAKMIGSHDFIIDGNELEIRTTMSIKGPLSFLWRKIVAEGVANGMEEQTNKLIERARNV
ncbi:MAG: polyketide cyclase [bacterium]|nr:polyketide cyclase [bacterium]